ncbi:2-oxoacid:acceptor oxidoreductase family protein [Vulcanisaeta distributa]|uniref:pyruvate synthase n=1 Tax=Vulcanisaeta distributa (strain DSM 14429 / JCM 11212 / NBRC 100878 / IC-017) TaxID=572478 RepID=E1QNL9_VULDI|nr:2-oxoacid:acceptor oxidoreductase family protein [Vulcanisaeta distributa]ADN51307.1 pyruvate/ketoisovalerate oxidoreductase, gamma subunit [Vulcanisaeta distributa DSM 14429]
MSASTIEITFFGRGGQGAVTAAQIIAQAAIRRGLFASSFPEYGAERRGAPVRAYVRLSREPVLAREPIERPDISVVFDTRLLSVFNIPQITKSYIVINALSIDDVRQSIGKFSGKVVYVNAYEISTKHLGKPIVNTTMLGALLKVLDLIDLDTVKELVLETFGKRLGKSNVDALEEAYKAAEVVVL